MKKEQSSGKAERTRRFIIERVAPVFNRKGYAGTSLTDLTEATKLTKGSIYGNFKNKDEVAEEAFRYNFSLLASRFTQKLDTAPTPADKLDTLLRCYRSAFEDIMSMGGCPILNTAADADDTHLPLRQMVQSAVTGLKKMIAGMVMDGIAVGQIKPETDPDKIAGLILSLVEGGLLIARIDGNRRYFDHSIELAGQVVGEVRK